MYKKYLLIFIVLVALHYFLDNRWLIAAWCGLGVLSAFRIPEARFPLLNIIGLETGVGILYWVSSWSRNGSLRYLSENSHVSVCVWPLAVIAVNILTAFLCAATFLLITNIFIMPSQKAGIPGKQ